MTSDTTTAPTASGIAADVRAGRSTAVDAVTEALLRIRARDDDVGARAAVR